MKLQLIKGATSRRVAIFIQDSSSASGAGLTGLLWNSAGIGWSYWREDEGNAGATSVTLATATRGTFASGGFVEKDAANLPGFYEIGIPDAALAAGADWVVMQLDGAADMAPLTLEIQLTGLDLNDGVRAGLSALPNVASPIVIAAAETGTLSTTQMTSDLAEATDDHYIGRTVIWTSGALAGQASDITDYLGSTGMLTYGALTEAPANGDSFVIV